MDEIEFGDFRFRVAGSFDSEGDLEFSIRGESAWVPFEEVIKLRDHLNAVLGQ